MKSRLVTAVMKASPHLIHPRNEVGTMLMITSWINPDANSQIIELEENGILFRLETDEIRIPYKHEGIWFMIESPSFPNISETINADPVQMRSMRELYDDLLDLAKKGEL
jgi:hypothetical protein